MTFRSSKVTAAAGGWRAEGELTLLGATRPFAFDVRLGDDRSIGAEAVLKQTLWGLKPYSTLFGALKVVDEVYDPRSTRAFLPDPGSDPALTPAVTIRTGSPQAFGASRVVRVRRGDDRLRSATSPRRRQRRGGGSCASWCGSRVNWAVKRGQTPL